MNAVPRVSVVIVSRGRPALLRRCLLSLSQVSYPAFEIIVVADPAGLAAISGTNGIKKIAFDEANISAARNLGIAAAAGEIVAFIDDDAAAEPTWLRHLIAPFSDPETSATGGFVRGRNGIEFQWRARVVGPTGFAREVEVANADAPFVPETGPDEAVKTEGTNFAVRRETLAKLGGFDPAFRFFLDETDLNMRLMKAGGQTVIVPLAQVHHGYAASAIRQSDRAPLDLFEIGASSAVFLRKHAPALQHAPAETAFHNEQRKRLLRHVVDGGLEPRDVDRVLRSLTAGFAEGRLRPLEHLPEIEPPLDAFLPIEVKDSGAPIVLSGRPWNRRRLSKAARVSVQSGRITSVFRFSPTALPHWRRFHTDGYWEQRGGLFGRANRTERRIRWQTFAQRLHKEWASVAKLRTIEANQPNEP